MTYPQELRERTPEWDISYPIRFYRNCAHGSKKDDNVLQLHWHEAFEIIDMQRGCAVFYIDSRPCEAVPGDLLFVPSGALHVGYSAADEEVEYVAIVFHTSLLSMDRSDVNHEHYVAPFLDGRAQLPDKLPIEDAEAAPFRRLIREATAESERQNNAYQLVVKSLLQQLYALLSRRFLPYLSTAAKPASLTRYAEEFKPLLIRIESEVGSPLSVGQASRMVNLNPSHFCKTFKKLTGRTYIDYVNWCRVNEASRLLRENKRSVTEIAEAIGCGNVNYFTKLYKKYKGIPPSRARRM